MSVDSAEPRRPRRIAVAHREGAALPVVAVPPLQRERFRRIVDVAAPAQNVASPTVESTSALRLPGEHPLPVQPKPPAQKPDSLDETQESQVPTEVAQVPFIAPPMPLGPEPPAMVYSGWEHPLAKLIQKMCSSADPAFTQWSVQIPLDERILPDTTLHIALSSCHLRLRFHTQSAWSQRLIFRSTSTLLQSLQEALPHVQDIDIDIT